MATATDRLTMCRIAVEGDPLFSVSNVEVQRPGPSYTIDTVRQLKREYRRPVTWLIGADMLMILPNWHQALDLVQEAEILIMRRPGVELDWGKLPAEFQRLRENVVNTPLLDVSATEIRRRVRAGEPIEHLTPPAVAQYIREHHLYR